jgi:large subunit ribosomal protein L21
MHAVITTGGKQYRVTEGQTLKIEKLVADAGSTVNFPVLMITDGDQVKIGVPLLKEGTVEASVIGEGRADKVEIVKFRRRKHHRKQMGHRQYYTEVKITKISLSS